MSSVFDPRASSRDRLSKLIRRAASQLVAQDDVWAKHEIHKLPAERIIRHLYHPETKQWTKDETIVKMEKEPFTHGAMRFCYRMKKLATPPMSATNHRFHSCGWTRASNYVAKCYHKGGVVDTSEEAKQAVRNDILLQYEAAYWAEKFNQSNPSKKIVFIRAYVVEFPDRPGQPLFAVERFIAGTDPYGAGFVKHNTNSGFVDEELRRTTPQVFSAHSFYKSRGTRLVADIQGIGDLYTDPQVLSIDYRFGDGDLGPRGMALFFHSFRHCALSDSLGIPIFALSRNELKRQAKYDDDELTVSDDEDDDDDDDDALNYTSSMNLGMKKLDRKFARLDVNRQKRMNSLKIPMDISNDEMKMTERRSNITKTRDEVRDSLRKSLVASLLHKSLKLSRSTSDVDEVTSCLRMATTDPEFDHHAFHRFPSGEIRERQYHSSKTNHRRGSVMRSVRDPMLPCEETKANIGKVHYHLACLHGMGRFPETIPHEVGPEDAPYDIFSVLFHLCHAASFSNVSACLSLARVKSGLDSSVADLLCTIVPIDFDGAKDLLRRAMDCPFPPSEPKAAAGCLLYQILQDEGTANGAVLMDVLNDTLTLMAKAEEERISIGRSKMRVSQGVEFAVGDKVEANFALEGVYYSGTVISISSDGAMITVRYDDDGSTEALCSEHVRHLNPALTVTLNYPLTDSEALGHENIDEKCIVETYVLQAELAELKAAAGETTLAAALLEEAAEGAMSDGKMQTATKWSLRACELQG